MIESLEQRQLYALDVFVDDGTLIIRGGDGDDHLIVERANDIRTPGLPIGAIQRFVRVRGLDGTTINGGADFVTRMVDLRLTLDLRGGNDRVELSGLIFGNATIDLGIGDDQVLLRHSRVQGNLEIAGGAGKDRVSIRDATVQGALSVDGGLGRDRFAVSRVLVKNDFRLHDTAGPTRATLNRLSIRRDASILTGNSIDRLTIISSTVFGDSLIRTLGQNDAIFVRGSVFHGKSPIDAGAGDNDVDREVILGWDFNEGEQGWQADFSGWWKGEIVGVKPDGSPRTAEEAFDLRAGLRPVVGLPTDESVIGYSMMGTNLTDSLAFVLFRRIDKTDGIAASTSYAITVEADLFSSSSASMTSQQAYLGAIGSEPLFQQIDPALPGLNTYSLRNFNPGNIAGPGPDGSFAGFVNSGLENPTAVRRRTFAVQRPVRVMATSAGELWIVLLVNTSFETRQGILVGGLRASLVPIALGD